MFDDFLLFRLTMYKPICKEPILIVNKFCLTLLQNGGSLTIFGKKWRVTRNLVNHFPIVDILARARESSEDDLDASFVECGDIRESFFLYVPCNHCELCRHSRQIDLINRATFETLTWDCPPFFFTLTYDNEHLPGLNVGNKRVSVGNLCYKDVQDFFKRLRINWTRKHLTHDVRYMVSGEYGSKRNRPHYHVILWNNPYHCSEMQPHLVDQLKRDIFEAWHKCSWYVFNQPDNFGQCRGGAAQYATKYVSKPFYLPAGRTVKPFIRCSSGHRGGLGSIYFRDKLDYLRDNPSVNEIDYVDERGRYQYMMLSKTFHKKCWTSPASQVPARFRNLYRQFIDVLQLLASVDGIEVDRAFELAELLRPSKYVRNTFILLKHHDCKLYWKEYYIDRFSLILSSLTFDLAEQFEVDEELIKRYYQHREFFVDRPINGYGQMINKILEKASVTLDKTKF